MKNIIEFGDCRETMRRWASQGVKAQMCVTSPPYFGLRDYGHEGQIGLEQTPEEYIDAMVEVFRCVRDVLADDGTLWLNIGDSYCAPNGRSSTGKSYSMGPNSWLGHLGNRQEVGIKRGFGEAKPKDLIGIPWMLAFALRADGWYLRQDIIWHKPNPMPESVRDRCTKAHEYIFLLSKSERYFFDSDAMKEPSADPEGSAARYKSAFGGKKNEALLATDQVHTRPIGMREFDGKRNRRSVWTVATRPYKGAHFATFPTALIEPCILAGSLSSGAYEPDDLILSPAGEGERDDDPSIMVGRAGWSRPRRDIEAIRPMSRAEQAAYAEQLRNSPHRESMMREAGGETTFAHYIRTDRNGARAVPPVLFDRWVAAGWLNRVSIPPRLAQPHRSVVLDPFMGSGTTAQAALQHGRAYLGCELNPDYKAMQDERIAQAKLDTTVNQLALPLEAMNAS